MFDIGFRIAIVQISEHSSSKVIEGEILRLKLESEQFVHVDKVDEVDEEHLDDSLEVERRLSEAKNVEHCVDIRE